MSHHANAPSPILLISGGKTVFEHPKTSLSVSVSIIALQLLRESYLGLSLHTEMCSKALQFSNDEGRSMKVTDDGI